jgi:stage III sporulation protein AG
MDERKKKSHVLRGGKKLVLILIAVGGVVLLLISGIFGGEEQSTEEYTDVGFYTQYLEGRICEIIESIDGVDEAVVFLTLDCSSEYVYRDDGASDFLILSGGDGEEAVRLCEIYPRVRGIAVVCTGGELARIKETVTELLSAALGLPYNKIKVAGS